MAQKKEGVPSKRNVSAKRNVSEKAPGKVCVEVIKDHYGIKAGEVFWKTESIANKMDRLGYYKIKAEG